MLTFTFLSFFIITHFNSFYKNSPKLAKLAAKNTIYSFKKGKTATNAHVFALFLLKIKLAITAVYIYCILCFHLIIFFAVQALICTFFTNPLRNDVKKKKNHYLSKLGCISSRDSVKVKENSKPVKSLKIECCCKHGCATV